MDAVIAWMHAHPSLVGGAALLGLLWLLFEMFYLLLRWIFLPSFRRRK